MARMNLTDCVNDVAPKHPPCFLNQIHWLEYLKSAASCQNHKGEQKVILLVDGNVTFNKQLDFCQDCESREHQKMRGTCKPNHLTEGEA